MAKRQLTTEEQFIAKRMKDEYQKIVDKIWEITRKEPGALTTNEVKFLRARRSYLDGAQLRRFESVLKLESSEGGELTYKELQDKAKDLGIKYVGVSFNDLKEQVEYAEAS